MNYLVRNICIIFTLFCNNTIFAQTNDTIIISNTDTTINNAIKTPDTSKPDSATIARILERKTLYYRFTYDFFSSFSILHTINEAPNNEPGNIYLFYNVSLSAEIIFNKISFNSYYFTDFGIKSYFDSIKVISDDHYNFKNSFSYQLGNSKFAANINILTKSQYYKHYTHYADSAGNMLSILNSSYMSPGYKSFSIGLKYFMVNKWSLELGLVNGMRTIVKNQKLYDEADADELFGIKKGEIKKLDFGVNLIFSFPIYSIAKNFYIENFSQVRVINSDLSNIGKYNFDINHAFHYVFLKYFRISLRTKCNYDYNISLKPNIVNYLTFGFYLNNTL